MEKRKDKREWHQISSDRSKSRLQFQMQMTHSELSFGDQLTWNSASGSQISKSASCITAMLPLR